MADEEPAAAKSSEAAPMELARRLAFLCLSEADAENLRALTPIFRRHADAFVEDFYRHLFAFQETSNFFGDPSVVARLKIAQKQHIESMLEAQWGEAYVEQRRKVGLRHAEVGIEPALFLGAYNQYVQFGFQDLKARLVDEDRAQLEKLLSALKAIFLDIGLTLDAYFAQSTQTLRQALDMYWKANIELRQFAHLASHDLKTPLATVANLCDEALDEFGEQMPAGARDLVEAARQRTFRMSRMIDELLAFTTLPDGNDANEDICSQAALAEAMERVRPAIEKRKISLVVAGDLPRVRGNSVRLREAFYNLLSNAVKFVDKDPAKITVGAKIVGQDCILSVADNGPGIPSEELERIFVPFRRLPMHRGLPGSGLGLYFTKIMIEQQGGRIWVESELGQGSRFNLQLKLAAE